MKVFFRETILIIFLGCTCTIALGQGSWTQKVDFGGSGRIKAVGFAINDKGYIGTGQNANTYFKDFWQYDPCDLWVRKADFGGTGRTGAAGFSIGNKGYIGTGDDGIGTYEKDFWEYDVATNLWTRKADFPGTGRRFAFAFSIGNKGYIGTGETNSGALMNDFWEYDPATDSWTQISSMPAVGRKYAGGFSLNGKAYVGCGSVGPLRDFWEYDPVTDTWTRKTDYPGVGPEATTSFTLGNYGYMGLGDNYVTFGRDLWQYNAIADTWVRMVDFTGTSREVSVGFSLCGKGYFGTGGQGLSIFYKDFWEYTPPDYTGGICFTEPVANFSSGDTFLCENACVNFVETSLNNPTAWQWSFPGGTPSSSILQHPGNICYGAAGNYAILLIVAKGNCADTLTKSIAIADTCTPIVSANGDVSGDSICPGNCVDFSAQFTVTPDSYHWEFPGGSPATSTLPNPNICYTNDGVFDVILIYSTNGSSDTITKSDFITVGSGSLSLAFTLSVTTANLQTGAVKVTVADGTPPYQYSLDNVNFQNSNIFTSLPLGTYQIYVTDSNGCTGQGTFIIDEANCCRND